MNPQDDNLDDRPGRQAEDRLVHALLLHLYDPQAVEHREWRVRRAMAALRTPIPLQSPPPAATSQARTVRFPGWLNRIAWAACALVLLAVGAWMFTYTPTSAMASLNDIIDALGRPGDRAYQIQMEDLPEPPGRKPADDCSATRLPRPGLNDAKLYLRDDRQYLLVRHDPNGGLTWDGYDGRQSWRVRNGALAEVRESLGAGGIPMPPMMADVPFSNLHQTLERIRVDYTVEELDQAALPSSGDLLRHAKVRRNSRWVKGPETIEIWADPQTAMPRRIVFDRAKIQGNRLPCRLTFDLVGKTDLPANWFSPASHVDQINVPTTTAPRKNPDLSPWITKAAACPALRSPTPADRGERTACRASDGRRSAGSHAVQRRSL